MPSRYAHSCLRKRSGYWQTGDPARWPAPKLAHRVAWFDAYGYWPKRLDHINGDPADNRLENLREVTAAQHSQNRRGSKRVIKCICFDRSRNQYLVRVQANGKRHHIGRYKTEEEARRAAVEAVKRLHGPYAAYRLGAHVTVAEIKP
jgi:HNH endonuclease/AP2 domain